MSEPRKHDDDNKIQGALCETISAMSALNMEPDPLKAPLGKGFYLSELDGWAAHCMEHLRAVFELLNEAHGERERDHYKIFKLEQQNNATQTETRIARAEVEALRALEDPLRRVTSILDQDNSWKTHQSCNCGYCSAIAASEHLDEVRKNRV